MSSTVTGPAQPLSLPAAALDRRWSAGHIRVLDGLRGLAVLAVMSYHFLGADDPEHFPVTGVVRVIQTIAGAGWCGVDLFFVLSGFLITGILLDAKGTSKTYFRSFYIRRVLRIFPLYYGVILFVAVGRHFDTIRQYFGIESVTASLGWMVAYLSNFVMAFRHDKMAFRPLAHLWSLAVEEHFYLVWPALVWLCSRRQLAIACGLFVVGAFVLRCDLALREPSWCSYMPYLLTPCRVDGLAMGALLAMVVRSNLNVNRMRKWAWILGSISLVGILALGFRGAIGWAGSHSADGGFSHYGRAMETGGFSLFAVFFSSVLVLAISAFPTSGARRVLESAPLRSVGRYSFAMYVLHLFFMRPFLQPVLGFLSLPWLASHLHSSNLALPVFAILAALATYVLAWLSWHLYESHFLRLKRLFPY